MDFLPNLTEDELRAKISELEKDCEKIEQENDLLDGYYERVKGEKLEIDKMSEEEIYQAINELLNPSTIQVDVGNIVLNSNSETESRRTKQPSNSSRRSHRSKTTSLSSSIGAGNTHILYKLDFPQKCEIASREIDQIEKNLQACKNTCEIIVDRLQSEIENLEISNQDHLKSRNDFDRDMKINEKTGKYLSEKFDRHMIEKGRARESFVKKLRLKFGAMASQFKKVTMQIKQKDDMGEVVTAVDFEQLKIENQQYLEKIDEKNSELLSMKSKASNTALKLGSKKKELSKTEQFNQATRKEIKNRLEMLKRCKDEEVNVKKDIEEAKLGLSNIEQKTEDFQVPPTRDYIQSKLKLEEIRHKAGIWLRKVEIAELKLKSVGSRWRSICSKNNA